MYSVYAQCTVYFRSTVSAMAGIMPPGRLDTTANIADNWKVWKQMWTIGAHYPETFQRELGTLPGTVHLEVEQGATPVVAPPRRVPSSFKSKLK